MAEDPLRTGEELFKKVGMLLNGVDLDKTRDIAVSLLLNTIRQRVARRSDAEALFNEIMGRAKTLLLDVHYDSVTGNRRVVFPYTQVVQAPLHVEEPKV